MKEIKRIIFLFIVVFLAKKSSAQHVTCEPGEVKWHPHPSDCTLYLICFHGVVHTMRCAPGLHWSRNTTECMLPEEANCILDYRCPPFDDPSNPIFLPNEEDCRRYYVCVNGIPNLRNCTEGLWWDINNNWCTFPDQVTCDNRTLITPPPPVTTTTPIITTTTTSTLTTTTTNGPPPDISGCWSGSQDLFDGQNYIKSMCIINRAVNYNNARIGCQDLNMNLFIVDTHLVNILFHNTTMRLLGQSHAAGHVWINGRRDIALDIWNVLNPDDTVRGLLFDGINWVSNQNVDGRTNGPCLRYSGAFGGGYQAVGWNCNNNGWFVCEHGHRTTTPDPTQPTILPTTPSLTTTTTAPGGGPNLNACAQRSNLFDQSGNYLKSLCIISNSQNYNTAQQTCRTNGMELFVIDSSPTQIALRASVAQLLSSHPRGFAWINGRIDDSCGNWFVFDPNRRQMFNGVHFVQTDNVIGRESGPCLRFTAQHSVSDPLWQGQGVDCNASSWLICEYFT